MKFGIFGHSIVDTLLFADRIPAPNTSTRITRMMQAWGGIGANIAVHAGGLGLDARLYSVVGEDFPMEFQMHLERMGVDLSGLVRMEDAQTPRCFLVTASQEQAALVYQGAYQKDTATLVKAFSKIRDLDVMHLSSGPPEVYEALSKDFDGKVHLDPAQEIHYIYNREKFMPLFQRCDVFFANESEAKVAMGFLGLPDIESIGKEVETFILTRGSKGCSVFFDKGRSDIGTYPATVKDTTGAGDAFRAGYLWGLEEGEDAVGCAIRGAAMGSFLVEKVGPQSVFPSKEMVRERMEHIRSRM